MGVPRIRLAAEAGLTIALAAVLHFITPWQMPQGGSVSLEMLPLFVFALLRGPVIGMACGALYGLVDLILEPYLFHAAQVLLDYPTAFGLVGLAGFWSERWQRLAGQGALGVATWTAVIPGITAGALGRYAAHVLSGLVFFSSFARDLGQAPLLYSLWYNLFVLVSAVGCAVVAVAILPVLRPMVGGRRV